jgi:hypothetical protein
MTHWQQWFNPSARSPSDLAPWILGAARRHCDRNYDDRPATGRSDFSNGDPNQ